MFIFIIKRDKYPKLTITFFYEHIFNISYYLLKNKEKYLSNVNQINNILYILVCH